MADERADNSHMCDLFQQIDLLPIARMLLNLWGIFIKSTSYRPHKRSKTDIFFILPVIAGESDQEVWWAGKNPFIVIRL